MQNTRRQLLQQPTRGRRHGRSAAFSLPFLEEGKKGKETNEMKKEGKKEVKVKEKGQGEGRGEECRIIRMYMKNRKQKACRHMTRLLAGVDLILFSAD